MDIKKLAGILVLAGVIAVIAALLWWNSFYGPIVGHMGRHLSDAYRCIYSSSGRCGFASGISQFVGKTPYNPILFWIGVVSLAAGALMRASVKS